MATPHIGKYGVFGAREYFDGRASAIEDLGYGAIWIGGSPPSDLAWYEEALGATERITIASGIVNVWSAPADEIAAKYFEFEEKYPGRFLLGIGAGHPEVDGKYQSPYQKVVSYLDELDELGVPKQRRVLAALRGKMLKLAAERTAGAHPYFMPVAHTKFARETIGPDVLIATEEKVVFETDEGKAWAAGSEAAGMYLGLSNYVNAWKEFGFPGLEVGARATGEFLDTLIARGAVGEIEAHLNRHFDAGADHVAIQVIPSSVDPVPGLGELADALGLA